jgi:hypothetical protein
LQDRFTKIACTIPSQNYSLLSNHLAREPR